MLRISMVFLLCVAPIFSNNAQGKEEPIVIHSLIGDKLDRAEEEYFKLFPTVKNFQEAEDWDIEQHLNMTSEQRQNIAKELRRRVYGDKPIDVKESVRKK